MKKEDLKFWKQKPKNNVASSWGKTPEQAKPEPRQEEEKQFTAEPAKSKLEMFKPSFKPLKVYHVHGLRTLKRIIAFFLLLINGIFALVSTAAANSLTFTLLFFLNSFVLLDYIWRTKKAKVEIDW